MQVKTILTTRLALALAVGLGAGAAAAQTATATPTDTTLGNKTVSVDADTDGLQVVAENITNDTATVTIYGIADGNETQVTNTTLNTSTETTDTYRYLAVNHTKYPDYRIHVDGDGAAQLEINKLQAVSGGGGFIDGVPSTSPRLAGIILLVVIVGGLGVREVM